MFRRLGYVFFFFQVISLHIISNRIEFLMNRRKKNDILLYIYLILEHVLDQDHDDVQNIDHVVEVIIDG
jgi:hypothetical protein